MADSNIWSLVQDSYPRRVGSMKSKQYSSGLEKTPSVKKKKRSKEEEQRDRLASEEPQYSMVSRNRLLGECTDTVTVRRTSSLNLPKSISVTRPAVVVVEERKSLAQLHSGKLKVDATAEVTEDTPKWGLDAIKEMGYQLLKKASDLWTAPHRDSDQSSTPSVDTVSRPNRDVYFDTVSRRTRDSSVSMMGMDYLTPKASVAAMESQRATLTNNINNVETSFRSHLNEFDHNIRDDQLLLSAQTLEGIRSHQKFYLYNRHCPIHGSANRLAPTKHGFEMRQRTSFVTGIDEAPMLGSHSFAAKLMRKRKRASVTGLERLRREKQKLKIKWNLCVISTAYVLLFTAFHGLQNLQSTVNSQSYLGVTSLSILYLSLAISSLFVPTFLINRLGCKQTIIVCMTMFTVYLFGNFVAEWYSLIPTSIVVGVATGCLWTANCIYITESGIRYAQLNIESSNVVVVRFFGIFMMIVHMGQVFGNLISWLILERAMDYAEPIDRVEKTCGHYFNIDSLSEYGRHNLQRPAQRIFLAVCAVYVCCTALATMTIAFFLNALHKDRMAKQEAPLCSNEMLMRTMANLSQPKPLLLIPLTLFNGMEQAFIVAEYTKAYIGCGLGISQIGAVMTAFGLASALCSLVFGPLIKLFGRMPLFAFGAVVNLLMIFTLLVWPFNPGDTAMFYVIACAWGMADGVWNTQINGFWVALLGEHLEVAFANYRLWESLGLTIGLLLTTLTRTEVFLQILLASLILGMLGYVAIEYFERIMEGFIEAKCILMKIYAEKVAGQKMGKSMEVSLISSGGWKKADEGTVNQIPELDVSLHV